MPPCADVYVLSTMRHRRVVDGFIATYVDVDRATASWALDTCLLPLDHKGHEDALRFDQWEHVVFDDLEDMIDLGLSRPWRAFRTYLPARRPMEGSVLCFTRTGDVIAGVSHVIDADANEAHGQAYRRMHEMQQRLPAVVAWAVPDEPPPLDPWSDRPWIGAHVLCNFENPAGEVTTWAGQTSRR